MKERIYHRQETKKQAENPNSYVLEQLQFPWRPIEESHSLNVTGNVADGRVGPSMSLFFNLVEATRMAMSIYVLLRWRGE